MHAVIWITGLSGAGKTTLAKAVQQYLHTLAVPCLHLDGDAVREAIQDQMIGHDKASRLANAYRIARLAKLLVEQNTCVCVSTMSLFHEIHAWNRANFSHYYEILLTVDKKVLLARDYKQVYNHNSAHILDHGYSDFRPEFPQDPHLIYENSAQRQDIHHVAQDILAKIDFFPTG